MAATIHDVADCAGVSLSTVSYVLSGKRPISDATRLRVEAAIAELGYVRHAGAHSIRSRKTNVIALVMPLDAGQDATVQMPLVATILSAARTQGFNVLLLTADDDLESIVGSSMVDGAIVMEVRMRDARIPALRKLARPTVLIGSALDVRGLTVVDMDLEGDIELCVGRLADLGHTRIGYVGHPEVLYEREANFAVRSRRAFEAACRRHGIEGVATTCERTEAGASEALERLLGGPEPVTGLVIYNESALGLVLAELRAREIGVPDHVSVVAVCPEEQATRYEKQLTCVPVLVDQLGERAVRLLMDKVAGMQDVAMTVTSHLVEGETTAPPPA